MKLGYEDKHFVYNRLNTYLVEYIPKNKKVLDVGCSIGVLGKYLKQNKNCIVYGVDISEMAIEESKKILDKAKVMDIVTNRLPFNDKFDVIVFGDILEHIVHPEEILKKFKKYLKNDGIIVCSIPNVANILTRIHLLFGNWDYRESGVLDNTHLRFFTKKTIRKLFRDSKLEIIKLDSSPLGVNKFVLVSKILNKINTKLFSMQFIIVSKMVVKK